MLDHGTPVDAAFSDVVIPGGMDGLRLASILRGRHPRIAVVLATGYSRALSESGGEAVAEVLSKPYGLDTLAGALDCALAAAARHAVASAGEPAADPVQ